MDWPQFVIVLDRAAMFMHARDLQALTAAYPGLAKRLRYRNRFINAADPAVLAYLRRCLRADRLSRAFDIAVGDVLIPVSETKRHEAACCLVSTLFGLARLAAFTHLNLVQLDVRFDSVARLVGYGTCATKVVRSRSAEDWTWPTKISDTYRTVRLQCIIKTMGVARAQSVSSWRYLAENGVLDWGVGANCVAAIAAHTRRMEFMDAMDMAENALLMTSTRGVYHHNITIPDKSMTELFGGIAADATMELLSHALSCRLWAAMSAKIRQMCICSMAERVCSRSGPCDLERLELVLDKFPATLPDAEDLAVRMVTLLCRHSRANTRDALGLVVKFAGTPNCFAAAREKIMAATDTIEYLTNVTAQC